MGKITFGRGGEREGGKEIGFILLTSRLAEPQQKTEARKGLIKGSLTSRLPFRLEGNN